jgi:transposase-like protein
LYQATSNNNNHAFYSQASWGTLEIKPYEKKKQGQNKGEKDRGKQRAIKNQIEKGEKNRKRRISHINSYSKETQITSITEKATAFLSLFVKTRNKIPAACEQFNHKRPNLLRFLPPFS